MVRSGCCSDVGILHVDHGASKIDGDADEMTRPCSTECPVVTQMTMQSLGVYDDGDVVHARRVKREGGDRFVGCRAVDLRRQPVTEQRARVSFRRRRRRHLGLAQRRAER